MDSCTGKLARGTFRYFKTEFEPYSVWDFAQFAYREKFVVVSPYSRTFSDPSRLIS